MFPLLEAGIGEALSVDPDDLDDDALAAALVAVHTAPRRSWPQSRPG